MLPRTPTTAGRVGALKSLVVSAIILVLPSAAVAQTVTEILHDGVSDDLPGKLDDPIRPLADGAGSVYVAGRASDNVFRISPGGTITEILGPSGGGAGQPLDGPTDLLVDGAGNVWVTGGASDNVFRIPPTGAIDVLLDATGDGAGQPLDEPVGMVRDSLGNVFVAGLRSNNVFRISPAGTVVAMLDASGDGAGNPLTQPKEMVVDGSGNVIVMGRASATVFRVEPNGSVSTLLGPNGLPGHPFTFPRDLDLDSAGNLYVTGTDDTFDTSCCGNGNAQVFKIAPSGAVSLFYDETLIGEPESLAVDAAGNVWTGSHVDTPFIGGLVKSTYHLYRVEASGTITEIPVLPGRHLDQLQTDAAGNLFWRSSLSKPPTLKWQRLFRATPSGVVTEVVDGTGNATGYSLEGDLAFTLDDVGNLLVAGSTLDFFTPGVGSDNVLKVATGGTVTELIDRGGVNPPSPVLDLVRPVDVVVDHAGNVFVTGEGTSNVLQWMPGGHVTEILDANGDGIGNVFDRGSALALDSADNVYAAGYFSDNVFRVTTGGVIQQILDASGDGLGNPATKPTAIAVDAADNVFVACRGSNNVFRITPAGTVTEIVDATSVPGPGFLDKPTDVVVDAAGVVYVTALTDNVLRIEPGGQVTEILKGLSDPSAVTIDAQGTVYVLSGGDVLRYAGGATTVFIDASTAGFTASNVVVDALGNVNTTSWIPSGWAVHRTTPAGVSTLLIDEVGAGSGVVLHTPSALAVDGLGTLYVTGKASNNAFVIKPADAWTDLGGATPGVNGAPRLGVNSPLTVNSPVDRYLVDAAPNALMLAWVSFTSVPWNVVGGTLHANPPSFQFLFQSDADGSSVLSTRWPPGYASGTEVYLQFIIQDPSSPHGITLSNAVTHTVP